MSEYCEVRTQAELDTALARDGVVPICMGSGSFRVSGSSSVVARESSRVEARGSSSVVAWESSRVEARGSSSVVAWGSSRVEARESSRVEARGSSSVVAWGSSSVVAWGSSRVEARESSRVVARESSSVVAWGSSRVVAWGSSRVEARGSSRVVAWGSSRVEAWGSSSVVAWGSSRVVARESSRVEARGSSSVVAWGSSRVEARESSRVVARESSSVEASKLVAVHRHAPTAVVRGGVIIEVRQPTTAEEWCDYYGARDAGDGIVTLYKAVGDDYVSSRGFAWTPGSTPEAPDWDGGEAECGGGLHFCAHPVMARECATGETTRYIACPVRIEDIVVHADAGIPQKVKARRCAGPVWECDIYGDPIETATTEVAL